MPGFANQVGGLVSVGLTEYQARAYLALLDLGEAKASQIVRASKVPRGRIYDVLEGLHAEGLVEIIPSSPRRFRPMPLHAFLERKRVKLRDQSADLERDIGPLAFPPEPGSGEGGGEFILFRKRRAVTAKLREMIDQATKEVFATCSEGSANLARTALFDAWQEKARAGVRLRISCDITQQNLEAVKTLSSFVEIHHQAVGNKAVTIMVVDQAQALFCRWDPDDGELLHGDDVALWSSDPGVVGSLRSMVEQAWERGIEADMRYRQIETGELRARIGPAPDEQTELITGPESVREAERLAIRSAKNRMYASTLNTVVEARFRSYQQVLNDARLRGIEFQLLTGFDGGTLGPLQELASHGAEVRVTDSPTLGRYLVVDDRLVLFPLRVEASVGPGQEPDSGIAEVLFRTSVEHSVEAIRQAFQRGWARAVSLEEFSSSLEGGSSSKASA